MMKIPGTRNTVNREKYGFWNPFYKKEEKI